MLQEWLNNLSICMESDLHKLDFEVIIKDFTQQKT